jgi:hypothetical protein
LNTLEDQRLLPPLLHPASMVDAIPVLDSIDFGSDICGARCVIGRTGDPLGFSAAIAEVCAEAKDADRRVIDVKLALDGAMLVALLVFERRDDEGDSE